MPTPTLLRGLLCACLTLSLTACASKPIIRTRTVTVHVPVYQPLPESLTAPVAVPELPAGPLTNEALADHIEAWKGFGKVCNDARAEVRARQPEVE